jgi:hypothetical protein
VVRSGEKQVRTIEEKRNNRRKTERYEEDEVRSRRKEKGSTEKKGIRTKCA